MVRPFILLAGLAAASVHAVPLERRIAQTIADSTQKWEQACLAAGGAQQCNPISITAFTTLLAAAGRCEQQNAGDTMVALGKKLGSAQMVSLAQIFVQQPRNTPNSVAVPYCQTAPQNAELNGLFQCQFAGANQNTFVGGAAVGAPGTIPFGLNAPLNPLGSCPAHPQGPIADGTQLVDQVQSTGAPTSPAPPQTAVALPAPSPAPSPSPSGSPAPPAQTSSGAGPVGFALANGQAAQKLNAQFATLTANSTCTAGDSACVGPDFGQCVGGQFVTTPCSAPAICVALPLVNSPGTSITCDTQADAEARIAKTGATGGLTGSGSTSASTLVPPTVSQTPAAPVPTPASTPVPASASASQAPAAPVVTSSSTPTSSGSGGFKLANGQKAQALNNKFQGLNATSSCQDGESACVKGGFAQCVGGSFVATPCAGGLICAALPLVNSAGTSITCTTQADALTRIQATGATGGLTG